MKLQLEIVASIAIKGKTPWPAICFMGDADKKLALIDDKHINYLYESGKHKKASSKLNEMLLDTLQVNHSADGSILVGMLNNKQIYLWHKERDIIWNVAVLPTLARQSEAIDKRNISLFVSNTGGRIILVVNCNKVFLWESSTNILQTCRKQKKSNKHAAQLAGHWAAITPSEPELLLDYQTEEGIVDTRFYIDKYLGDCCSCSIIFTAGTSIRITTLQLRWPCSQEATSVTGAQFIANWNTCEQEINSIVPGGNLIPQRGAYVARLSPDGSLLAVAINQASSHMNRLLYVSPVTGIIVATQMCGSGVRMPVTINYKNYWTADLSWSGDGLYLACMMNQGTLCILPRLGDPVPLQTHGCSIHMGPKPFLPLHPLITVESSSKKQPDSKLINATDPFLQHFSVKTHPTQPVIICSDGYMLTVLRLEAQYTTCLQLSSNILDEANEFMKEICQSCPELFQNIISLSIMGPNEAKLKNPVIQNTCAPVPQRASYFIEEISDSLDMGDEKSDGFSQNENYLMNDLLSNMQTGRLVFGDAQNLNQTLDFANLDDGTCFSYNGDVDESLTHVEQSLLGCWALLASHSGSWLLSHEEVAFKLVTNTIKLMNMRLCTGSTLSGEQDGVQKCFSLVKGVLQLINLDILNQHLSLATMRLIRGTLHLFLAASKTDFLQTYNALHACYHILRLSEALFLATYCYSDNVKFTCPGRKTDKEKLILQGSGASQISRQGNLHLLSAVRTDLAKQASEQFCTDARFGGLWLSLYYQCYFFIKNAYQQEFKSPHVKYARHLLKLLQCKLLVKKSKPIVSLKRRHHVSVVDGLNLDLALGTWMQKLKSLSLGRLLGIEGTKGLHGLFYCLVLQGDVYRAILLVELLLHGTSVMDAVTLSCSSQVDDTILDRLNDLPLVHEKRENHPIALICKPAVRHLIMTVSRFMASYFTSRALFICPPQHPEMLPPLHVENHVDQRVIYISQKWFACQVREASLEEVWTPNRAIHYLLLCGLIPEAVWFTNNLGDWKASIVLAAAHNAHKMISPRVYSREADEDCPDIYLPPPLSPTVILTDYVDLVIEALSRKDNLDDTKPVESVLEHFLLASTISKVDALPHILNNIISILKKIAFEIPAIVPSAFYLPAPPIYCPQPVPTDKDMTEDEKAEWAWRTKASQLIQLMFHILRASHLCLPISRAYVHSVMAAFKKTLKLQPPGYMSDTVIDIQVIQESYVTAASGLDAVKQHPSVVQVLSNFRDMCSFTWMFYVRDRLSFLLRKKHHLMEKKLQGLKVGHQTWHEHCQVTLNWALHLLPFSRTMQDDEGELQISSLSLINELTEDNAKVAVLAQHFHNIEGLPPTVLSRLQAILRSWQTLHTNYVGHENTQKKRANVNKVPLSVSYDDQVLKIQSIIRKKIKMFGEYEEYVFDNVPDQTYLTPCENKSTIGSRPFESEVDFLRFLDTLYAVSFNGDVKFEQQNSEKIPLVLPFANAVQEEELIKISDANVTRADHLNHDAEVNHFDFVGIDYKSHLQYQSPKPFTSTGLFNMPAKESDSVKMELSPVHKNRSVMPSVVEALSFTVPQACDLENLHYPRKYRRLHKQVAWWQGWADRTHSVINKSDIDVSSPSKTPATFKINVNTQVLVYSLWQFEFAGNAAERVYTSNGRSLKTRHTNKSSSPARQRGQGNTNNKKLTKNPDQSGDKQLPEDTSINYNAIHDNEDMKVNNSPRLKKPIKNKVE